MKEMLKIEGKNILVLFSGGRTSGFLAKVMKEIYSEKNNVVFVFANTGKEREETLRFVDKCDKEFKLELIWIESVIENEKGKGVSYKIIDYKTANRTGFPFTRVISKFGLPSKLFRHCTRDLKERPMDKFGKDIFGTNEFIKVLGIRADEPHRFTNKKNVITPLVEMNVSENLIRSWWKRQSFDLELKDYEGNCDLCFLKSKRKRLTLLSENPNIADWWKVQEEVFGNEFQPIFDVRNNLSINELVELSKKPFQKQIDKYDERQKQPEMDLDLDFDIDCFCKND